MTDNLEDGILLDESCVLSLAELSQACAMHAEWVLELVDEGILEPTQDESLVCHFAAPQLTRAFKVMHLQRDLGVNLAGAALALDLMDEINLLRSRLACFQNQ